MTIRQNVLLGDAMRRIEMLEARVGNLHAEVLSLRAEKDSWRENSVQIPPITERRGPGRPPNPR